MNRKTYRIKKQKRRLRKKLAKLQNRRKRLLRHKDSVRIRDNYFKGCTTQMDNFTKIQFTIEAAVEMPSQTIFGLFVDNRVFQIDILQKVKGFTFKYSITVILSGVRSLTEANEVGSQVRRRLLALFVVAGRADASASNNLYTTYNGQDYVRSVSGDERPIVSLWSPIYLDTLKSLSISDLEWNAITRFYPALLSGPDSDKFEAFAGAIDVLGNHEFSELNRQVKARMKKYCMEVLKLDEALSIDIIEARHPKIHENRFDTKIANHMDVLIHLVADDLCGRFSLPVRQGICREIGEPKISLGLVKNSSSV